VYGDCACSGGGSSSLGLWDRVARPRGGQRSEISWLQAGALGEFFTDAWRPFPVRRKTFKRNFPQTHEPNREWCDRPTVLDATRGVECSGVCRGKDISPQNILPPAFHVEPAPFGGPCPGPWEGWIAFQPRAFEVHPRWLLNGPSGGTALFPGGEPEIADSFREYSLPHESVCMED